MLLYDLSAIIAFKKSILSMCPSIVCMCMRICESICHKFYLREHLTKAYLPWIFYPSFYNFTENIDKHIEAIVPCMYSPKDMFTTVI